MATKGTKKAAGAAKVKVLTRDDAVGKVILPTFSELHKQGGLVSLADLPVGMKLHQLHLKQRYDFVTGREGDTPIIKMVKPKTAGPWKSLSQAAAHATGHAMRGSAVLKDERGVVLMRPPSYGERAAGTPKAPKAPRPAKGKKADGKNGSVKVTKGIRCGERGCGAMIPASEVGAHMATHAAPTPEGFQPLQAVPDEREEARVHDHEEPEQRAATPGPAKPADADAKARKADQQRARRAAAKAS